MVSPELARQLLGGALVVGNAVYVLDADLAGLQTISKRPEREAAVVLLPREALLLCSRDQPSILEQTASGLVVEGRDPDDVHLNLSARSHERRSSQSSQPPTSRQELPGRGKA